MFRTKALGRYVDLICIDGLSVRAAFKRISREFNRKTANWCVRVCGDELPKVAR